TALTELAKRLHIKPEEIFAAGDHLNDLSMLTQKCARWVAAPANAVEAVKKAVRLENGIVSDLKHGYGVADALRRALASAKS
ncbi:MAG TPA: HAD hydrolase family protein, partial [Verrucomicrobiae bacterium]|nr:HAD hydrolase family protein [Verrucomicrobiae bacterium]